MDELNAVGDPDLRSALLYARSRPLAVTADELAANQGVHRNVARSRLDRLTEAGLLTVGYERRTGRTGPGAGRPARIYSVAPELSAIEFPERRYEVLVGHLLDALPARGRPERLREAGVAFGVDLARSSGVRPAKTLRGGVERMCAAVGRLGYQAAAEELGTDAAVIVTPTCPLRPLVRAHPVAAELDRGMWAGLAAQALAGIDVGEIVCDTCDCHTSDAPCRVELRVGR
jgi:predicted ArsR family transcriptional regulator